VTQGENTTTRIDALLTNRGAACVLPDRLAIAILRAGRAAAVVGNPLRSAASRAIAAGGHVTLSGDWSNWCGSRTSLTVHASYGSLGVRMRPHVVPVCVQRARPSRLTRV
jgi:hypothetical protein